MYMTQPDRQRIQHIRDYCEEIRKTIDCYSSPEAVLRGTACRKLIIKRYTDKTVSSMLLETVLSYGQQWREHRGENHSADGVLLLR